MPAQRVKEQSSSAVFLIDPDDTLNWIPNSTVYFSLWDSFNGITTVSDGTLGPCFGVYFTMSNAHLAKTASSARVCIYDINGGGYRWITSQAIFNKYGFSSSKIQTQSSVSPVGSDLWDF